MVEIEWSENARERFREILEYHDARNSEYSVKLIKKLQNHLELLKKFPQMGRLVPEKNSRNAREVFVDNFRLIYVYLKEKTSIPRIIVVPTPSMISVTLTCRWVTS